MLELERGPAKRVRSRRSLRLWMSLIEERIDIRYFNVLRNGNILKWEKMFFPSTLFDSTSISFSYKTLSSEDFQV